MDFALIAVSVIAQAAAAGLAVRLNFRHGRRWAWMLIAAGLVAMLAPRLAMLVRQLFANSRLPATFPYEQVLSRTASVATCVASLLILGGVASIGPLFHTIARAEADLRDRTTRLEATVRESQNNLALAREIQQRLLPQRPPVIPGYDVAAASTPAESVGGDYFDYFPLKNSEWALIVSDVSGHGLGSALQMAQVQALFHAIADSVQDPSNVLARTNRLLQPFSPPGRFVAAFIAMLNPTTGSLRYSTAGHLAWILRSGCDLPERLHNEGLVLGILPDTPYTDSKTELCPGDVLVFVTDGVTETLACDGRLFGVDRLFDTVRAHRARNAAEILGAIMATARLWRGTAPQYDDVTVMIVRSTKDVFPPITPIPAAVRAGNPPGCSESVVPASESVAHLRIAR